MMLIGFIKNGSKNRVTMPVRTFRGTSKLHFLTHPIFIGAAKIEAKNFPFIHIVLLPSFFTDYPQLIHRQR
jgi:hypothetical protein